jgi:hypothetical protein
MLLNKMQDKDSMEKLDKTIEQKRKDKPKENT